MIGKAEPSEAELDEKTRARTIVDLLQGEYPDAKVTLNYTSPLELLVATILAAQCTDERVNVVTKTLFKKYRKAEDYANADLEELQKEVRSTGFYRNKARNIKKCCQILVEKFNSELPKTMEEMVKLPGVARKTANIVLSNAYGVIEGIAVDTHVRRIAKRLGLTEQENPDKIEKDLMDLVSRDKWMRLTDLLVFHGRRNCMAKKPKCAVCILNKICPSAFTLD